MFIWLRKQLTETNFGQLIYFTLKVGDYVLNVLRSWMNTRQCTIGGNEPEATVVSRYDRVSTGKSNGNYKPAVNLKAMKFDVVDEEFGEC